MQGIGPGRLAATTGTKFKMCAKGFFGALTPPATFAGKNFAGEAFADPFVCSCSSALGADLSPKFWS